MDRGVPHTGARRAALLVLTAVLLTGVALLAATQGRAQTSEVVFTDWTSYSASIANGTLQGAAMSLSGEIGPYTITNGSETKFNRPAFTPPLVKSDSLEVRSNTAGNPYTFVFGRTVTDPVIHLGDLSTSVAFNAALTVERVSGDPGFTVSGATVTGTGGANGTVRVKGTFSGLAFAATSDPADVFYLQLGAFTAAVAPPPAPSFSLSPPEGRAAARAYLPPGGKASLPLDVRRNSTSSGRVRLSVTGLGAGVSGQFQPATVGGTGRSRTNLVLTATKKAARTTRNMTITGTPVDASVGAVPRTVRGTVTVQGNLAVRVEGIEVNQGVQTWEQPDRSVYNGVVLARHKKTVARVYADLLGVDSQRSGAQRPPFGMLLYGHDDRNRRLPGSPLSPVFSPKPAHLSRNDYGLTRIERGSGRVPFTFVLPHSWSEGNTRLQARAVGVAQPKGTRPPDTLMCVIQRCGAAPIAALLDVGYTQPPAVTTKHMNALLEPVVHPYDKRYPLQGDTTGVSAKPPKIFEKLIASYPGTIFWLDRNNNGSVIPRYRAVEYATDTAILEAAEAWDKRNGKPGNGTVGIYVQGNNPGIAKGRVAVASGRSLGKEMWRPMTSVAHETFHLFGFPHASPDCGSGGEKWPIDFGRLGGVGLDTTERSGVAGEPFRVFPDYSNEVPKFDLMSYCGIQQLDRDHWISVRNWNRVMRQSKASPRALRAHRSVARAAAVDELIVSGRVIPNSGLTVTSVDRATTPAAAGTPSVYRLVGRNAAGRVQAIAAMTRQELDGGAGSPPFTSLSGQLPRAGVTRVDFIDPAGNVVATRSTTGKAQARLLSPRKGSRAGKGTNLKVRWSAAGPDAKAYRAVIEASANNGRSFQQVWAGPNSGRASIPTALVSASRRARLRLRVGDGFQEAVATSGRFTLVPRKPSVQIIEPKSGQRADAGGGVRLFGTATDDRGRTIPGRRLLWTAGRTKLGRGADIVRPLPAGTRRVRLTATAGKRKGSASVAVRVRSTTPFFTRLNARRRGRTATLTVTATQAARLSVKGKRYKVGPRAKRIRVKVGRKKTVKLRLVLSAGGKRSTNTITVRR
ncbi:MAG TPA: hypothetical protein VEX39_01905 [Thermoleophilaceae bacterium]|nr:hypothetical protein [Thermoleophilaceae bacterium]